jgi:eukaryotic-like serine/threonine-protein kinase
METTLRSALADYELSDGIGPGCYLARPPERLGVGTEGPVLVWELPVDAAGWPGLSADLLLYASVDSPHLLRLIETGPDPDPAGVGAYLVTEDPPGGSLEAPQRMLRVAEMVLAVAGAARGAHALHEAGMAHGSISPESVFLTARGGVLGPPRPVGPAGAVARADRWQSLELLDPELVRGGTPSRSSDVWALAATVHQACAGAPLYRGLEREQAVTAVQRVLFGWPVVDSTVPSDLADVLEGCFDRDPAKRPATALELAERLEAAEVPV